MSKVQVTIVKTIEEANCVIKFYQKHGIPLHAVPDPMFGFSLVTEKGHMNKALVLYEASCCIVNIITGLVVRKAAWEGCVSQKTCLDCVCR